MVQRIPSAKHPSTRFANNWQNRYTDAVPPGGQEQPGIPPAIPPPSTPTVNRQPSGGLDGVQVSTEERGAILQAIQQGDEDNAAKTYSRRFFENVLSKVCFFLF